MAHQSLYRRYRPRRFDEVRGQDHVIGALRNAVRDQTEGHAYLFSGPRGTGKTSTARILAKALNCENPQGGEPCCDCTSCTDVEAGRSFDIFEMDAASNRRLEDVKQLIERTSVGSPGRTKVYILDEVHMLTAEASNALLKTLEEPPEHVRFVLATTDPQKVLPTIRSRTQHFEFQLLSAGELERQVRFVVADAGLDVDDEAIAWVVQKGRGSSRDTLSALDQVVAAGGVVARAEPVDALYQALVDRDTGAAVLAVADALAQGHDPRVLGAAFLDSLRDAFLLSLEVDVPHLVDAERERCGRWAAALGTATLTRAMEALGAALVEMRQAADPRVPLEVALVRLTSVEGDSLDALVARIERLEAALADGSAPRTTTPGAAPSAAPADPPPVVGPTPAAPEATPAGTRGADEPDDRTSDGPARARAALARRRARAEHDAAAAEAPLPPNPPEPPPRPARASAAPVTPSSAAPEPPRHAGGPAPEPPRSAAAGDRGGPAPPPPEPVGAPEAPDVARPPASGRSGGSAPETAAPEVDRPGSPGADPSPVRAAGGPVVLDVDAVTEALEQVVVPSMRGVAKAIYSQGRVLRVDADGVVFALAPGAPMDRAERSRAEVEAALTGHLGSSVTLRLTDDAAAPAGAAGSRRGAPEISGGAVDLGEPEVDEEIPIDLTELEDADDVAASGIERLTRAFPGAQLITEDEVAP